MINLKFNLYRVKGIYNKPVIKNICNRYKMRCLVDTGARVPVWCSGEKELLSYYPSCQKQNAIFILSGFGKGYEIANVYTIPDFILSDGKSKIVFKNLVVAVIDKDFSIDLILSYTMFNKMNISIDTFSNRNSFHNVDPNFKVASQKSVYNVGYRLLNTDNIISNFRSYNIIDDIYIFTQ